MHCLCLAGPVDQHLVPAEGNPARAAVGSLPWPARWAAAAFPSCIILDCCLAHASPCCRALLLSFCLPQVEGAPQVVKAGLKKEEAEALQKTLVEGECGSSNMQLLGCCRRAADADAADLLPLAGCV